jgi:hypothetical protein
MMHIRDFPRSAAYLKASNYRLDDPSMTPYAWAVCLSEAWTDEELVAAGTVNFDTMTGEQLLPELDRLLAVKARRAPMSPEDRESLKAFIGSRGIKVSALKSPEDYWHVASILWPHTVKADAGTSLKRLHKLIKGMTKAQRRTASVNLSQVPAKWRPS